MKKLIKVTAAILAAAALLTGAYTLGHKNGIHHAMVDSEVWVYEEGKNLADTWAAPSDLWATIILDGETYEHWPIYAE